MKCHSAGLYIHMPWCIKKCPYCDFNSHKSPKALPEAEYIRALIQDFKEDIARFAELGTRREKIITSIFIGGGTPSLFSADSYQQLFTQLKEAVTFADALEVTLEANPGTFEQHRFASYLEAGINRLSLGVQSFEEATLKRLGRIHSFQESITAIKTAQQLGFTNMNIDLMYACPEQTPAQALRDLEMALELTPPHLSWYQFTLEPNTYFYRHPPQLPVEDDIAEIEESGLKLLAMNGYTRYEISAFEKGGARCQHNLNYWAFGDYFGIGAGAHGKLTDPDTQQIFRTQKHRLPHQYLNAEKSFLVEQSALNDSEKCFEFVLNMSRLEDWIPFQRFRDTTGLDIHHLQPFLQSALEKGLIEVNSDCWRVTTFGRRFTNDLQQIAL